MDMTHHLTVLVEAENLGKGARRLNNMHGIRRDHVFKIGEFSLFSF